MTRFETSYVLHQNKPHFSLFQLVYQKIKILNYVKFNQEILTKLLARMHQLNINLLCSSMCQTTYSLCEIKHFVKQAEFMNSFWGVTFEYITYFITSFLFLTLLWTILFTDMIYRFCKRRFGHFVRVAIFWIDLNRTDVGAPGKFVTGDPNLKRWPRSSTPDLEFFRRGNKRSITKWRMWKSRIRTRDPMISSTTL